MARRRRTPSAEGPARPPPPLPADPPPGTPLGPCPLCGRPMIAGPSVDRHHWVPRTQGGRLASPLHRVCHRMIHRLFDEATLARAYPDADSLRRAPEMARFLAWVRRQPPTYVDWPRSGADEKRRGRLGGARRR